MIAGIAPFTSALPRLGSEFLGDAGTDLALHTRHFLKFGFENLAAGRVPLWNPALFCGSDFIPSVHATLFYPPNWLPMLALPEPLGVNVAVIAHVVALAVGICAWARRRGAAPEGAALAAMAAAMGSVVAPRVFAGHITIVFGLAWVPWLFMAQERMLSDPPYSADRWFRRSRTPWRWFGVLLAMSVLGSHTQISYYVAGLLAANLALNCVGRAGAWRFFASQVRVQGTAVVLALGLSAIMWVPLFDIARDASRNAAARYASWYQLFSMPPEAYATLLAPALFGYGHVYFGRWLWWETCMYAGIPALALGLTAGAAGLFRRRPDPVAVLAFAAMSLAGLSYVPGAWHGLGLIPGWAMFRGHGKLAQFGVVFLAVLAADGMTALRQAPASSWAGRFAWKISFVVGMVAAIALVTVPSAGWTTFLVSIADTCCSIPVRVNGPARAAADAMEFFRNSLGATAVTGFFMAWLLDAKNVARLRGWLWKASLLGLAACDLLLMSSSATTRSFPPKLNHFPPHVADYLRAQPAGTGRVLAPTLDGANAAMADGFESPGGYDFTVARTYDTWLCAVLGEPRGALNNLSVFTEDSRLLDSANARYLVVPRGSVDITNVALRPLASNLDGFDVFARTGALPRAYIVGTARVIPDDEDAILAALTRPGFDPSREVVISPGVEGSAEGIAPPETLAGAVGGPVVEVAVTARTSKTVTLAAAPCAGWLVLSDAWSRRWTATVNGTAAPVRRANAAFRAVAVKAGDRVEFRFNNGGFVAGAFITMTTLAGLAMGVAVALAAARRRRNGIKA